MKTQKPKDEHEKKKPWVKPQLVVYGDIEKITKEKNIISPGSVANSSTF
jgi:hypothetical protein